MIIDMNNGVEGRVRVKMCGMTRAADAVIASEAGVDAVGVVVHAPGRSRAVDIDTARSILSVVPAFVGRVGVFVDAPIEVVVDLALKLQLTQVQLHGRETPGYVNMLAPISVIKAVTPGEAPDWLASRPANLAALLIDSPGGGHGMPNDWDAVEAVLRDRMDLPMIVLAGGLTPDNVGEVVARFSPMVSLLAVDVSSGVEDRAPGVKSAEKIREFMARVASAHPSGKSGVLR